MNIQSSIAEPVLARIAANLNLYDEDYRFKCRDDFGFFRQHIRRKMRSNGTPTARPASSHHKTQ